MKITGLNSVLSRLQFDDSAIGAILEKSGLDILSDTENKMSSVDAVVASSYNMFVTKTNNGWIVNVGSDLDLSAFLEFGTGGFVVSPDADVSSAYMMEFFKNGKGTLRPSPALYPSYRTRRIELVDNLNNYLKSKYG